MVFWPILRYNHLGKPPFALRIDSCLVEGAGRRVEILRCGIRFSYRGVHSGLEFRVLGLGFTMHGCKALRL